MSFAGIIIGATTFFCIGVFHPIVIKAEYSFGAKCWWAFLLIGMGFVAGSLFVENMIFSTCLGVIAFSCFWSITELFQQRKRVDKGWFPEGPGHSI
jgi:hypothetical protein